MARLSKEPAKIFDNFSAGGAIAGITESIFASYFERETNAAYSDLVDGGHSSSAGTTVRTLLSLKDLQNPQRPRFTAAQAQEIFKQESQIWLHRKISFLQQHIKSMFGKSAGNFFLDDTLVEGSISRLIGSATLADVKGDFAISAHNGSVLPHQEAILFSRMTNQNNRKPVFSHDADITIGHMIRGSTAVPGIYPSKKIEGIGEISDFGHVYGANRAFQRFRRFQTPGTKIHFIEFGGPRYTGLSPEKVNTTSILGLAFNGYLARGTANHSYSDGVQSIGEEIGFDAVHNLTPLIDTHIISDRKLPSENILDASVANIRLVEEFTQDYIERNQDTFLRVADFLGENLALKQRPAFVPARVEIKKPAQKPGFLSFFTRSQPPRGASPAIA